MAGRLAPKEVLEYLLSLNLQLIKSEEFVVGIVSSGCLQKVQHFVPDLINGFRADPSHITIFERWADEAIRGIFLDVLQLLIGLGIEYPMVAAYLAGCSGSKAMLDAVQAWSDSTGNESGSPAQSQEQVINGALGSGGVELCSV